MKKEVDAINQFFGTMFSQQASSKGLKPCHKIPAKSNGRLQALQVAGKK